MIQRISSIGAGFEKGKAPGCQVNLAATLGHQEATFAEFVREHRDEFARVLGGNTGSRALSTAGQRHVSRAVMSPGCGVAWRDILVRRCCR